MNCGWYIYYFPDFERAMKGKNHTILCYSYRWRLQVICILIFAFILFSIFLFFPPVKNITFMHVENCT